MAQVPIRWLRYGMGSVLADLCGVDLSGGGQGLEETVAVLPGLR
jgi:hypothetical protein